MQSSSISHKDKVKVFRTIISWFFNSGFFYLGWILTIKFALDGDYWLGPFINLLIIVLHLASIKQRAFEMALILTLPLFGSFLLDGALVISGVLHYSGGGDWSAPLWVISLWGLFATSINHSLSWVGKKLWLAVGTGAIGGTLSYLAAIKVGVAQFLVPEWTGIACLAVAWGVVMPLCYAYNSWLRRFF